MVWQSWLTPISKADTLWSLHLISWTATAPLQKCEKLHFTRRNWFVVASLNSDIHTCFRYVKNEPSIQKLLFPFLSWKTIIPQQDKLRKNADGDVQTWCFGWTCIFSLFNKNLFWCLATQIVAVFESKTLARYHQVVKKIWFLDMWLELAVSWVNPPYRLK